MDLSLASLYIFLLIFLAFLAFLFWLRWRMLVSKGRFALTVLSTIFACLVTGIASMNVGIPEMIASKIFVTLGFDPINNSIPSFLAFILTLVAMFFIYRFGSTTVEKWSAPPRISEIGLREKYRENSIIALTFEQVKFLVNNQKDHLASDAMTNWEEKLSEVPKPVPIKVLLRDMLISAISEIRIPDEGWRDDGKLWVGEMLGLRSEDKCPIIVLICDTGSNLSEIQGRINKLTEKFPNLDEYRFFAVYISGEDTEQETYSFKINGCEKTISVYSSRSMILKGLDLVHYARDIINQFEETKVGGTSVTLQNSFVELQVNTNHSQDKAENLSTKLTDWLAQTNNEHITLTGEYGQGKSTALLKFCYDWAKRFIDSNASGEKIPLLIELRGQNPYQVDPLSFLSLWCARYKLPPQQVYNLIKAGEAVIIFEGFDELRDAGRPFYRHQHFNALWRFAYPKTKLIFTGRPNFFLDQEEINRTLRSQETRKLTGDAYTSVWKLKKLDPTQIAEACRSYDQTVKNGIIKAIGSNTDFMDIVARPSMLPVVATIWNEIEDMQKTEGVTLTGAILIEKYIQAIFSRKEAELEKDRINRDAPSGARYLILPKEVREFLTICVAWRMSGLKAKNTIPRVEITRMVQELLNPLFKMAEADGVSPKIATGLIEFKKRFEDKGIAERVETITTEICSAGLLIPDPAGGSTNLRFPHKQFFEFLVAKSIAIKTNYNRLRATELLEKSSDNIEIMSRLRSETNSIHYLAECIGPDIKRFISKGYRYILAYITLNYILFEYIDTIMLKNMNLFKKNKIKVRQLMMNNDFMSINFKRYVLTYILTVISSAYILLLYILYDNDSSSFISMKQEFGGFIFIIAAVILMLSMILMTSLFMPKYNDDLLIIKDFSHHIQLKATGQHYIKKNTTKLIFRFLIKGQVQHETPYKDYDFDDKYFLYPANEFGQT